MNASWLIILPALVCQAEAPMKVEQTDTHVQIETNALQARMNKKGYVSGVAAGSFLDKKTGARDVGFGLHIMDFLLAPGWRDDGYSRDPLLHGREKKNGAAPGELGFFDLSKHYVEGPQICTQAKQLKPEVIRGDGFVALKMEYRFHQPGQGYQAGSLWQQTLVFQPGVRYVVCSEQITSVNASDNLFYRIDMPGHVKHKKGDTFHQVYLSYHGLIPARAFEKDFAPDEKFLYQRQEGKIPERMIRAYQVKVKGEPGPWLAGMTLDPGVTSEAWCHQRGYICFIQELHGRKVAKGDTLGAAYIVGWFDSVAEMHQVYDRHRGKSRIAIEKGKWELR